MVYSGILGYVGSSGDSLVLHCASLTVNNKMAAVKVTLLK